MSQPQGPDRPRLIYFPLFMDDSRGNLCAIEGGKDIPFEIKRVFYIYDTPNSAVRGEHGHKKCEQVIIAMNGLFKVNAGGQEFILTSPHDGLYVPTGVVIALHDFSRDAVCLVLCSEHYDESDYIYD